MLRAAVVLVGVLAMSGCSGGQSQVESSTAAASTSASSTSSSRSSSATSERSSGGSEVPKAATRNTKDAAKALGQHYFVSIGEAGRTGQTQRLADLGSPTCEVCNQLVKDIKGSTKKGWLIDRQPYKLSEVEATKRPDKGYKVTMVVDVAKHYRLDRKGKRIATAVPEQYRVTSHVVWQEGRLLVADWILEDV